MKRLEYFATFPKRNFTDKQRSVLEKIYSTKRIRTREQYEQVAMDLSLSYKQVYQWFKRQDYKKRNEVLAAVCKKQAASNRSLIFSDKQRDGLEKLFFRNPYPTREKQEKIAKDLDITYQQVYQWFKRQHYKVEKEKPLPCDENLISENEHKTLEENYFRNGYPSREQIEFAYKLGLTYAPIRTTVEYRRKSERLGIISNNTVSAFSEEQIQKLEKGFSSNMFPTCKQQKEIAATIGVPYIHVQQWFVQRRCSQRNKKKV